MDLTELQKRNYAATVRRGLIKPDTLKFEFTLKLDEECNELDLAILNRDKFNEAEELADVIIVCLNYAKHFGIDIQSALEQKTLYNESRTD